MVRITGYQITEENEPPLGPGFDLLIKFKSSLTKGEEDKVVNALGNFGGESPSVDCPHMQDKQALMWFPTLEAAEAAYQRVVQACK